MSGREWLASALVAAIFAGNVRAIVRGTDDWPFSSVPMFRQRFGEFALPPRLRLAGVASGASRALDAGDFGLDPDQLHATIFGGPGVGRTCGALGDAYNRRRPPDARLTSLHVRIEWIPRPGSSRREQPTIVHCPLAAAPAP